MQCQMKKRDGKRCGAQALSGDRYCSLHADARRAVELGSRGGRRRAIYKPGDLRDFPPPKSAADMRDLLAQAIVEIRLGKLDSRVANSLAYLGAGFLRSVEIGDLETRLELLEAKSAADKPKNGGSQ